MPGGTVSENREDNQAGGIPGWLRPWMHWRFKRFWLLVALLLYTLAGFFLAPWAVQHTLTRAMADTGRGLSITQVRTNPYALTLEMTGFALADGDGETLLEFDRLFVNLQTSSLFRWAWTFRLIHLAGLHAHEERFEGSDTRFIRLLTDLAGDQELPEEEEEDAPPRAIIQKLEILDARLGIIDRPTGDYQAVFGPIRIDVEDVRTLPDHAGSQAVVLNLNDADRIEWRGDLQLIPFRSHGQLELIGADLPNVRRFLDYYLPFDPLFERVDVRFDYAVNLVEAGLSLQVSNLLTEVDGASLTLDEGGDPVVRLAHLRANGGALDLLERTASLAMVSLDGLSVRAALREDGSLSLLDLAPPSGSTNEAPPTVDTSPWQLRVDRLDLANGRADLVDETSEPDLALGLRELTASLAGLDLADGTVMPATLSTLLDSGGHVAYEGDLTLFPGLSTRGRLTLEAVALPLVQPYLNPIARVTLAGGALDLAGTLAHDPDQLLSLAGEMAITGFELHDGVRDERLAAWDRLQLDRFELDWAAQRVNTSVLEFQGLFGRFHIAEDLSTNVGDLLVASTAGEADEAPPLPAISVGGIRLDGASLDFSDFSLPLPFRTEIRELAGDVSTLSTTSSEPASVKLEGQVNEYGLARIDGALDAWDPTQQTDITMTFRNLEISRLSPYTIQFAGYAIEQGRMDMDLGYVLDQRQLQGENNIVIREMELGEKVDHPDAGSLPLGLAVALLKDSEGVIDIDVPVEGDLDNPEFRIGGVIWKAIGNLITKIVTAPFRLLGNLVGMDSEDFGTMAFQPGRADVSPPDEEKLAKLGEAMLKRPELVVEVGGSWAPGPDRRALQEAHVAADLETWLDANPGDGDELSTDRDRRALEALHAAAAPGEPLDALQAQYSAAPAEDPEAAPVLDEAAYIAALRERLVSLADVGEAELDALARSRAAAVIARLHESQPEAELNVREVDPESVETAADGAVPLELGVSTGD